MNGQEQDEYAETIRHVIGTRFFGGRAEALNNQSDRCGADYEKHHSPEDSQ